MSVRMTHATMKVLDAFSNQLTASLSGADIAKTTGLMAGTLYPILKRLERVGWLRSQWEKIDPSEEGRPRRKYYKFTAIGQKQYALALQARQKRILSPKPSGEVLA